MITHGSVLGFFRGAFWLRSRVGLCLVPSRTLLYPALRFRDLGSLAVSGSHMAVNEQSHFKGVLFVLPVSGSHIVSHMSIVLSVSGSHMAVTCQSHFKKVSSALSVSGTQMAFTCQSHVKGISFVLSVICQSQVKRHWSGPLAVIDGSYNGYRRHL